MKNVKTNAGDTRVTLNLKKTKIIGLCHIAIERRKSKMNLSTKCNCCLKEDVCSIKGEYQKQVEAIKSVIQNENIEYSVKCKRFNAGQSIR